MMKTKLDRCGPLYYCTTVCKKMFKMSWRSPIPSTEVIPPNMESGMQIVRSLCVGESEVPYNSVVKASISGT